MKHSSEFLDATEIRTGRSVLVPKTSTRPIEPVTVTLTVWQSVTWWPLCYTVTVIT
jgi:hypothetical protein